MHVLMCIGALSVLKRIYGIMVFWYRSSLRKEKDLLDYGKWAVVTGSTGEDESDSLWWFVACYGVCISTWLLRM